MRYYILVGPIAAVVAAWSATWFYKADQLRTEIQRRANQSTLAREWSYRELEITGFPFRMLVDLSGPRLALRGPPREFRWRTDRIKAVGQIWQPRHILLDLTGRHDFKTKIGGQWRQLALDSSEAMASVETDAENNPERFSLDIKNITLRHDGAAALRGERLQFHARAAPRTPGSLDLALRGDALEVAEGALPANLAGLPRSVRLLDLQITVTGLSRAGLPGDRLAAETAGASDGIENALARWRDDGGTLEITTFHALWGGMDISATGSLALDSAMRPIGALTARIKGHDELLDIAVATGAMDKDNLTAARLVLGLLAAAGGGVLSVPVRLQDGQLFLGPAPIAKLGSVTGDPAGD